MKKGGEAGRKLEKNGGRDHSDAAKALNETFGGIVLGFSGTGNLHPQDIQEQSLLFSPGTNIGPPNPDLLDLRMTTSCRPALRLANKRMRESDNSGKGQLVAVFSPPGQSKDLNLKEESTDERGKDPCQSWLPECSGEDPNFELKDNMFIFFGPQADLPRPAYCPPVYQTTEESVFEYFESHNLETLMENMLTLLCINLPEDPFEYMSDYCEQMMKCRKDPTEFEKLDLIYQPAHLLALFAIFDKAERKYITMEQYRNAMEMLGVSRYNPQPIGFEENMVTEDVFFDESTKALDLLTKTFLE